MIIDIYDDPQRELLRSKVASARFVERYIDPPEKLASYPDDVFALVMRDGQQTIRKFACVDKAQTGLSALYFQSTWKNLPSNAVKVAATNLSTALGWYDMDVPGDIQKLAEWNPEHVTHSALEKRASAGLLYPYVDVTNHKTAAAFADDIVVTKPDPAEIPKIASVRDLSKALSHFSRESYGFNTMEKVAYCRHLVNSARTLGIKMAALPESVRKWGSTKVASPDEVVEKLARRAQVLPEEKRASYLRDLQVALAPVRDMDMLEDASRMVEKIASIDSVYGLDDQVYVEDPYQVVFDMEKDATYRWEDYRTGVVVTGDDLHKWASAEIEKLAQTFNSDVVDQFRQDPVHVFDAIPDGMKLAFVKTVAESR